jgi:hypothetical protein
MRDFPFTAARERALAHFPIADRVCKPKTTSGQLMELREADSTAFDEMVEKYFEGEFVDLDEMDLLGDRMIDEIATKENRYAI